MRRLLRVCLVAAVAASLTACLSEEPPRPPTPTIVVLAPTRPALQAPSPVASPSPSPVISAQLYTVVAGDTLVSIAERQLGDASLWQTIFQANRDVLASPEALQIGMRLRIPSPARPTTTPGA